MDKHTSGPWYADDKGYVWRRPPSHLYQNGGGVAGDKPLAFANKGWYAEGEQGYPLEANARLIAAAPELLEALQAICEYTAELNPNQGFDGNDCDAVNMARAAIKKATGE